MIGRSGERGSGISDMMMMMMRDSCCFMGCYFKDLFNIAHSILVQFLSSFFSICFVNVHMVHPYT